MFFSLHKYFIIFIQLTQKKMCRKVGELFSSARYVLQALSLFPMVRFHTTPKRVGFLARPR